jgi:ABC-type transport system substrate-binding protein
MGYKAIGLALILGAALWLKVRYEEIPTQGVRVKLLKVGYPTYWGSLTPALQHTAYADALLANQFEALVREANGGTIQSELAKSWTVNSDFTKIRFYLDGERTFSNGQKLTAKVVKDAWEYGLKLNPRSSNSSLQDVLYLVEGFKDFEKTGHLTGIRIIDDLTVEITFTHPFRTALSEFATGRMSIFIHDKDGIYGTGPYIIQEKKDRHLQLTRNHYFSGAIPFSEVEVTVVDPKEASRALESGDIDVYGYADRAQIDSCDGPISCFAGLESSHLNLTLNGLSGRFFENPKYRLALQYLVHKHLREIQLPLNYQSNLNIDPQPYLKLQAGRLSDSEARSLVEEGAKYVKEMVEATHDRPIYMISSELSNWMQDFLSKFDIRFSRQSGIIETKDRIQMFYKTFEPDIILGGSSLASGDPDGLFHSIARNGAIFSPMLYRKSVSDLLESGRLILDPQKLDAHYKEVSREFLRQVPSIHIGFVRDLFAYNPKTVQPVHGLRDREGNQFTIFEQP